MSLRPPQLRGRKPWFSAMLAAMLACLLGSCERERGAPPVLVGPAQTPMTELQPGPALPQPQLRNPFEGSVVAMNEGRRLFTWFNCVGCHAAGGGGMGPALMDNHWRYGSDPADIRATILEGRPNGMPSFRGKISEDDLWKIVLYVRSLSGLTSKELPEGARSLPLQESASGNLKPQPQPQPDVQGKTRAPGAHE